MFESVFESFSPLMEKKWEGGRDMVDPIVSTCSIQLCNGLWKDLTLWAALVFWWEGREDPAILPLADGIFHLFVTLIAVLWRSFVPEPQRCLENRPSHEIYCFEDESPFMLKAFTYLEVDAKVTDDFQINISIPWNPQKNKHILSVLRGLQ